MLIVLCVLPHPLIIIFVKIITHFGLTIIFIPAHNYNTAGTLQLLVLLLVVVVVVAVSLWLGMYICMHGLIIFVMNV